MKKFIALTVCLFMLIGLVACGSDTTTTTTTAAPGETTTAAPGEIDWLTAEDITDMPETTIRYWYYESPERTALGEQQAAEFMDMYPNIKIVGSTAPDYVDNEMLLPYIKTKNHSHIHQSVNNEDLWYIDHDLLYPLDTLPGFQEQWDRLYPQYNYEWIDGHVYSLSWYVSPMLLYFNTELVVEAGLDPDNPPVTYSEFFEWAEALTKRDAAGNVIQWAMAPWIGEDWWYWEFMVYPFYYNATGTNSYISEDGTQATFNTDMGRKMYEFWDFMFTNEYAARASFELNPFINGQVAIGLEGPWNVRTIANDAPPGFEYFITHLPKPDDSTVTDRRTWSLVRNFALIPDTELTDEENARTIRASWEFMKFLLSDEQLAADYAISGDIPPVRDILTNPLFTEITDGYGEKMEQIIAMAKDSYIDGMDTIYVVETNNYLQQAFLKIAYGEMTAAEAVDWAEAEVNKVLTEGR